PAPWSGADVGSVGIAGTSLHNAGTFTLEGSGVDIWGTADGFRYVYQALSGDGEIVARVTGIENTNSGANAGVMIRESLSAGAPHASTVLTASSGIGFVRRAGASASSSVSTATGAMPYWVRVVRSGNSFTSFRSSNGTTWTQVGSAVTITMNTNVLIGIVVTAKNNTTLCTATFDSVQVIAGAPRASAGTATLSSTTMAAATMRSAMAAAKRSMPVFSTTRVSALKSLLDENANIVP
ncbi:MAG: hypothetical protein ABIP55_07435, partial [Tepidisphaeraceae bacterium]